MLHYMFNVPKSTSFKDSDRRIIRGNEENDRKEKKTE